MLKIFKSLEYKHVIEELVNRDLSCELAGGCGGWSSG